MEQKLKTLKLILSVLHPILLASIVLLLSHGMGLAFQNLRVPSSTFLAFHLAICMAGLLFGWSLIRTKQKFGSLSSAFHRVIGIFLVGGMTVINLMVAGAAFLAFSLQSIYAIPLTILGGVLGWICLLLLAESEEDENEEENLSAESIASETKQETSASIFGGVFHGILNGIVWLLYLIIFAFGTYYFYLLKAVLVDGSQVDPLQLFTNIPNLVVAIAPNLVAIAVIIPLIYVGYGLWNATLAHIRKNKHPDINRDLTETEIDLIDLCIEKLEETVKAHHKTWIEFAIWASYFGLMCALFAAIFWFILMDTFGLGGRLFIENRVAGLNWFIYSDSIGVSDIALIFVAIIAPGSLIMWVCSFSQRLFVASVLEQKKENSTDPMDRLGKLRHDIALDVRKRLITSAKLFDPIKYLKLKHQRLGKIIHYCSVGIIAVTLCFWILDRRSYVLASPDGLTHVAYWSGEKRQTPYDQITAAHLRCGESGDNGFRLWLEVVIDDGSEVRILDYENGRTISLALPESIDAMENLAKRLKGSGNLIKFYSKDGWSNDKFFKEKTNECRAGITRLIDAETAERVVDLVDSTSI